MVARLKRAQSRGAVLRYVGTLKAVSARAGIKNSRTIIQSPRPRAATTSSRFTIKRYARTPLVVQGPGAGAQTSPRMGVFSDILKLLNYLPH